MALLGMGEQALNNDFTISNTFWFCLGIKIFLNY